MREGQFGSREPDMSLASGNDFDNLLQDASRSLRQGKHHSPRSISRCFWEGQGVGNLRPPTSWSGAMATTTASGSVRQRFSPHPAACGVELPSHPVAIGLPKVRLSLWYVPNERSWCPLGVSYPKEWAPPIGRVSTSNDRHIMATTLSDPHPPPTHRHGFFGSLESRSAASFL